jgi:chemotaxis signal transduction protein
MIAQTAQERLLLYSVGGQHYASPLDDLREVIELPGGQEEGIPKIRGHRVKVCELSNILGKPRNSVTEEMGPLLVVEVGESFIGLRAHSVHGMVVPEKVYPLPTNLSSLPQGSIVGAMVMPRELVRSQAEPVERDVPAVEIDAWETRGDNSPVVGKAYDIIIIIDLKGIAEGIMNADEEPI